MNGVQVLKIIKRLLLGIIVLGFTMSLSSCTNVSPKNSGNVGMLISSDLQDEEWNQIGYKGLQQIKDQFDVDVLLKENIQTKYDIINAVDELEKQGANLVFGHSSRDGKIFVDVAKLYPDIHFVYFNGGYFRDNVTSINISAHAIGFFTGMIAGKMSKTNHVGIIANNEWQPEIEGFYEGVKFENPETIVHIDYITGFNEKEIALNIYNQMKESNTDVFYPAGHAFSKVIVEQASIDDVYSIGYFLKDEDVNEQSMLTSTIQHIDQLYLKTAEQYYEQELEGGIAYYDLTEDAITFSSFSPLIPSDFQEKIYHYISKFKETNLLPNELQYDQK